MCTAVDGYLARKLNETSDFGAWVMIPMFSIHDIWLQNSTNWKILVVSDKAWDVFLELFVYHLWCCTVSDIADI